ncbi:MAG: hypothetical protein LAO21_07940 [Acidobacteriia bacterium]|nr:hypothetical protein [Terriglobia bacterium]
MGTAKVMFHKCIQDSVDYGSDDEHMVSAVFFDLETNGQVHPDLSVEIRQMVGGGPMDVGDPKGYAGPINRTAFRQAVEAYFRELIGPEGSEDAQGGRLQNNIFLEDKVVEIEV